MPSSAHPLTEPNTSSANSRENARELLSRDQIQEQYGLSRRWLELAALSGEGPPMIKISRRMVRYQRGAFDAWLIDRMVGSTSKSTEGNGNGATQ